MIGLGQVILKVVEFMKANTFKWSKPHPSKAFHSQFPCVAAIWTVQNLTWKSLNLFEIIQLIRLVTIAEFYVHPSANPRGTFSVRSGIPTTRTSVFPPEAVPSIKRITKFLFERLALLIQLELFKKPAKWHWFGTLADLVFFETPLSAQQ